MSTVNYMGTELDDSIEIVVDESGVISIDGEVHEDLNTVSLDSGDDEVSISLSSLNHLMGKLQLNFGDESGGGDKLIITIDEAVFSNADEIKADLDLLIAEIYKEKADLLDMTKSKVESMIEEFALKHDLEAEALQNLKATNVENIDVVVKEEPDSIFVVSKMLETNSYAANNEAFNITERIFTRDSNHQVLTEERLVDASADGTINSSRIITYSDHITTYDMDGNLTFSSVLKDFGNIVLLEKSSNTYDEGNLISTLLELDYHADGHIDSREFITNTYDAQNKLLSSFSEADWNADGHIDGSFSTTFFYDGASDLFSSSIAEQDNGNNGTIEYLMAIDYTYTEIFV